MRRKNLLLMTIMTFLSIGWSVNVVGQSHIDVMELTKEVLSKVGRLKVTVRNAKAVNGFVADYYIRLDTTLDNIWHEIMRRKQVLTSLPSKLNGKKKPEKNTEVFAIHEYENRKAMNYCKALNDALKVTSHFTKNKKVFFAKGKYLIPYKYKPKAFEVYSPIFDTIAHIANANPMLDFEVYFKIDGYSDANSTPRGSELFNDMVQRIGTDDLNADEINTYISYLRAYDIAEVLTKLGRKKRRLITNKERVDFIFKPKGFGTNIPEHLADKSEPADNLRRVVLVSWYILPKF